MLFTLKKCIIIKNTKMLMEITFFHYKMLIANTKRNRIC